MAPSSPADLAVYIGRFQPLHLGHLSLIYQTLDQGRHVVLVLGSAHQARTPKNPFTWQERAEMIRAALPEADQERVHLLPVRDYYDEARWVQAVRQGVGALAHTLNLGPQPTVRLVGHFKDTSSLYLRQFEGWDLVSVPRAGAVDAVQVRTTLLGQGPQGLEASLRQLAPSLPASTVQWLRQWAQGPHLAQLAGEWALLQADRAAWAVAPYPPVFVTVDALVQCAGQVLLIQRGRAPGRGLWALPGGFIDLNETAYTSALRELREETCLDLPADTWQAALRGQAVFDHPGRSQRGRVITHGFCFDLGERALPPAQAADDAMALRWVPVAELGLLEDQFHDDHFHILDHFLGLLPQA